MGESLRSGMMSMGGSSTSLKWDMMTQSEGSSTSLKWMMLSDPAPENKVLH